MNLSKSEDFSSNFNCLDHQVALFNALFFRPFIHSWFILFHQSCQSNFPNWFRKWFEYFGILENILPRLSLQGLKNFKNAEESLLWTKDKVLFQFLLIFNVWWILCWDFFVVQNPGDSHIPKKIVRGSKIKWWSKFHNAM